MRFQRMALDANLIDETLTNAKVDLIFHKVCGVSPHMSLTQFLDAIVRMSATKYPSLPRNEAVLRLFNEHLASFSGTQTATVEGLDDASVAAVGSARGPLQTLYEGYFVGECRQISQKSASASQSETQSAFVKVMTDFEVLPELLPKSMAFAVFREVARARDFPVSIREAVVGEAPVLGRNFTYVHFAAAVILVAKRCFGDDGGTAVLRLFDWMDSSKGRLVFASQHPGNMKSGTANFRILPEKAAASLNSERRGAGSARRGSGTGQAARRSSGARPSSEPSSGASPASEAVGIRPASDPAEGQTAAIVEMSPAPEGLSDDRLVQIKPELRRLVLQIFGHYAAIGDPLNRTNLSTLKFMRFLRDCGLVGCERPASASKELEFSPADRMMRSSRSNSTPNLARPKSGSDPAGIPGSPAGVPAAHSGRRGTTQVAQGRPRQSPANVAGRSSQRFTISASKPLRSPGADGSESGLPLRVFPVPLLTQVEADLIFVSASRVDSATGKPSTGKRILASKRGSLTAAKRHHLPPEGFLHALQGVALRCFPATPEDSLENFGERILLPLSETLLEVKGQDVSFAAELMADPETVALLERCQPGLEQIYSHYAQEHAGRPAHWSSEAMSRFAEDFDLLSEVSHLPLQKIFRDCTHYESLAGKGADGEMSYGTFQLALLMIAHKVHVAPYQGMQPLDRIINLFQRLNTTAGPTAAGSAWKSSEAPLIPGLPSPAALQASGQQRRPSTQQSSSHSRTERQRASAVEMSWEFMMQQNAG